VKQDGCTIQYVKEQTLEVCWTAINITKVAIEYIKSYIKLICNSGIII